MGDYGCVQRFPALVPVNCSKGRWHYPLNNSLKGVDSTYSVDSDCFTSLCFQHKRTLEQLSSLAAEKEELSQRCHELDEQVL